MLNVHKFTFRIKPDTSVVVVGTEFELDCFQRWLDSISALGNKLDALIELSAGLRRNHGHIARGGLSTYDTNVYSDELDGIIEEHLKAAQRRDAREVYEKDFYSF